jgi:hypothetical protein
MRSSSISPIRWLLAFAARLRFPQLFLLTAAVFLLDMVIPDVIPFVDEVILGLVTTMLGSIRRKTSEMPPDDTGGDSDEKPNPSA